MGDKIFLAEMEDMSDKIQLLRNKNKLKDILQIMKSTLNPN